MNNQHFEISEFKSKSGVKRIFSAFFYSIDGFRTAWKFEHAFRQELMIAILGGDWFRQINCLFLIEKANESNLTSKIFISSVRVNINSKCENLSI